MVRSYQYDNRQCIGNTRMTPAKPQKCWENAVQHPCVGCITNGHGRASCLAQRQRRCEATSGHGRGHFSAAGGDCIALTDREEWSGGGQTMPKEDGHAENIGT